MEIGRDDFSDDASKTHRRELHLLERRKLARTEDRGEQFIVVDHEVRCRLHRSGINASWLNAIRESRKLMRTLENDVVGGWIWGDSRGDIEF